MFKSWSRLSSQLGSISSGSDRYVSRELHNEEQLQNLHDLGLLADPKKERSKRAHERADVHSNASVSSRSLRFPSRSNQHLPPSASTSSMRGSSRYMRSDSIGGDSSSSSNRQTPRSKRGMTGVLDIERAYTRRDRTFTGTYCAVCEEPLEHTLRGEKILQLSCAHVTHEHCFYEYIKEFESVQCPQCHAPLGLDSSRGGNVLDMEKLGAIVRAAQASNAQDVRNNQDRGGSSNAWEGRQNRNEDVPRTELPGREDEPPHQYVHTRDRSSGTSRTFQSFSADQRQSNGRRHDYDVSAMETTLSPRYASKNPIPPPTVLVRSEFPTLTRSKQQQSLTCLITVEVADGKWRPRPADLKPRLGGRIKPQDDQMNMESVSAIGQKPPGEPYENAEELEQMTKELHARVDNWHGLDFTRFGKLRLHGPLKVGKDRQSWQELECFLFAEMLICVKEKKIPPSVQSRDWDDASKAPSKTKCTLKGSIMIKKHLKQIEHSPNDLILTLNLSVTELPSFHLHFENRTQLEIWRYALIELNNPEAARKAQITQSDQFQDEEDLKPSAVIRSPSMASSWGPARSTITAPTEYTESMAIGAVPPIPNSLHVPVDVVIVVPVSSSMHGLKITVLKDMLRFLVHTLGERDRMGLVTFGSNGGAVPLVHMTTKVWPGWFQIISSIKAVGQKTLKADLVEGANAAMDLLMQRKFTNPLSSILLISDSSNTDAESVDFVVSRAEAAKVSIYSFGLGLTHKPDTMMELSSRTKAAYTYVKDWMMLRECVAGCLGSLQGTAHQNVKLKMRLPDGSPAKFAKISGALHITKRATGRDAEAALGDLRFGDKRDVLVQLVINPDDLGSDQRPQDEWESIVSGLEALGGPLNEDDNRRESIEEVPIIQADLHYSDPLREGSISHLPRPSLLTITMLPGGSKGDGPGTPPIPPHPQVVQRRMELLTSDMLTRALALVTRGQHDRAHNLLRETRSILKGLGKGKLDVNQSSTTPVIGRSETPQDLATPTTATATTLGDKEDTESQASVATTEPTEPATTEQIQTPKAEQHMSFGHSAGVDSDIMAALDTELDSSLEWINHPAVFGRDSRKSVLQAIGVISSQRAFTFRTPLEELLASRISSIKRMAEQARSWRDDEEETLTEEAA